MIFVGLAGSCFGVEIKFGTQGLLAHLGSERCPMFSNSPSNASARTQSSFSMLKNSLRQVYTAPNDTQFNDLLRKLDSRSQGPNR